MRTPNPTATRPVRLGHLMRAMTPPALSSAAALCRAEADPDLFYPITADDVVKAKAVCGGCPVNDECADWAITSGEPFGVWGGLTEAERRAERAKRVGAAR